MRETSHETNTKNNLLTICSLSKHIGSYNKHRIKQIPYHQFETLCLQQQRNKNDHSSKSVVTIELEEKMISNIKCDVEKKKKSNLLSVYESNNNKRIESNKKISKQTRYPEVFNFCVDTPFKNSIKIGQCTKMISKDQMKMMFVDKMMHPIVSYSKEKSIRKTTIKFQSNNTEQHRRIKSNLENKKYKSIPQTSQKNKRIRKNVQLTNMVRKPIARKDYFVFGLNNRPSLQNKIQVFRDMMWKINYSNCLYVHTPIQLNTQYRFYIGSGNNSCLIRGIMRRRSWWVQANSLKDEEKIHLIWTQLKVSSVYQEQQNCNKKLAENSPDEDIGQIIDANHKKIFGISDEQIWATHLTKNAITQKKITDQTYLRRMKLYQKKQITKIQQSSKFSLHNHLQHNYHIGNKKALFYNLKKYFELKRINPYTVIPLTFHITRGSKDPEFKIFLQHYKQISEQNNINKLRNLWIIKPGQCTNRGNGITVCANIDEIKIRIDGRERNNDGRLRTFILQQYIEHPMLYHRRKFDIRHYLLLTCINGIYKAYWYEQGYIRTSSYEFSTKSATSNIYIHLTNDAVQKRHDNYGKYEKGNKLSYADFQKYLDNSQPSKKLNFFEQVIPKMKNIAAEAIRSTYSLIDPKRKGYNFQLFGLDFMIDQNFQPWLIEINTNPCLEMCCPLLNRLIPNLIQNVIRIAVDPLFLPPQNWMLSRKPYFGDDVLTENKFEIIFDEFSEGEVYEQLYKGVQRINTNMGKVEEDNQTYEDDGNENWQNSLI